MPPPFTQGRRWRALFPQGRLWQSDVFHKGGFAERCFKKAPSCRREGGTPPRICPWQSSRCRGATEGLLKPRQSTTPPSRQAVPPPLTQGRADYNNKCNSKKDRQYSNQGVKCSYPTHIFNGGKNKDAIFLILYVI